MVKKLKVHMLNLCLGLSIVFYLEIIQVSEGFPVINSTVSPRLFS